VLGRELLHGCLAARAPLAWAAPAGPGAAAGTSAFTWVVLRMWPLWPLLQWPHAAACTPGLSVLQLCNMHVCLAWFVLPAATSTSMLTCKHTGIQPASIGVLSQHLKDMRSA
jgi:hypothetical protein